MLSLIVQNVHDWIARVAKTSRHKFYVIRSTGDFVRCVNFQLKITRVGVRVGQWHAQLGGRPHNLSAPGRVAADSRVVFWQNKPLTNHD